MDPLRGHGSPEWNPDGRKWRPMPLELVPAMKAKSKRSAVLRRWWFWSIAATCLVGVALARG